MFSTLPPKQDVSWLQMKRFLRNRLWSSTSKYAYQKFVNDVNTWCSKLWPMHKIRSILWNSHNVYFFEENYDCKFEGEVVRLLFSHCSPLWFEILIEVHCYLIRERLGYYLLRLLETTKHCATRNRVRSNVWVLLQTKVIVILFISKFFQSFVKLLI